MVVGIDKRLKDLLSTSCDYNERLFYKWLEEEIQIKVYYSKDTRIGRVEYVMWWKS